VTLAGINRNAVNVSVHEVMTHRVFTAGPDDDMHEVDGAGQRPS
jgi:hypothetical protein